MVVSNPADIFTILQKGIKNRQTAATLCNKASSRSHSIFTLKIMLKEINLALGLVVRCFHGPAAGHDFDKLRGARACSFSRVPFQ